MLNASDKYFSFHNICTAFISLCLSPLSLSLCYCFCQLFYVTVHNIIVTLKQQHKLQQSYRFQLSLFWFLIQICPLLFWVEFSFPRFCFISYSHWSLRQAGRQLLRFVSLSLSLSYLRIYQVDIRYSLESHYCYKKFLDTFIEATTKCVLSAAFALLCLFKYFTRHLIIIILMHRPVSRSQEHCPKETKRKVCWAELKVIFREMSSWHSLLRLS